MMNSRTLRDDGPGGPPGLVGIGLVLAALLCALPYASAQEEAPGEHFIDVGAEGDDALIASGISHREGPVEGMGPVFDSTFRWCEDAFTLNLPVFPDRLNHVSVRVGAPESHRLLVESEGQPIAVVRAMGDHQLDFFLRADIIGEREVVPVTLRAPVLLGPASERDTRILYAPLDWVRVRPMDTAGMARGATPVIIKIGDPGDELFVANGLYGREGPYTQFGDFFRNTFRWAQPGFALRLPVFPNSDNTIILSASIAGRYGFAG